MGNETPDQELERLRKAEEQRKRDEWNEVDQRRRDADGGL